jgi:anti-sigma factor RsiW
MDRGTQICDVIRPLLPLSAGGDLDPRELKRVSEHLLGCASCKKEEATFRQVISVAGSAYSSRYQLPPIVRNRIAISAAERARNRSWTARIPLWGLLAAGRPGLMASVAALLIAAVAVPTLFAKGSYTVYKSHDPRLLTHAEAHEVAGNIWTDTDPGSARFVYYRIE